MTALTLIRPEVVEVNRSELRQNQSATLRLAKGFKVLLISATDENDEKLVLDKAYFHDLIEKLRSAMETLEIMSDQKLFKGIMVAAKTIDEDIRLGKLKSHEEAFGED